MSTVELDLYLDQKKREAITLLSYLLMSTQSRFRPKEESRSSLTIRSVDGGSGTKLKIVLVSVNFSGLNTFGKYLSRRIISPKI